MSTKTNYFLWLNLSNNVMFSAITSSSVGYTLILLICLYGIADCLLCVGSTPTSGNTEDLSQYDPGCITGCKLLTLTLHGIAQCAIEGYAKRQLN